MENITQWFVIVYVIAEIVLPIVFFIFMLILAYRVARQDYKKSKEDKEFDDAMSKVHAVLKRANERQQHHQTPQEANEVLTSTPQESPEQQTI